METCAVDDCNRPIKSKGLCGRHYENKRRYGYVVPSKDLPIDQLIERIGWTVTPDGCWEWNGKRNDQGYGIVNSQKNGLADARAHRVMYELKVGPIPDGHEIRHRCDNPPCIRPDHLEPGTHRQNMGDMKVRKRTGRSYENNDSLCVNGHDITAPGAVKTLVSKRGPYRKCVACARIRSREYARRRREGLV